ncbi:S8 family serine peptidase [Candidatus Poriferisocius sp.]|uniref:S8 family serine peptidase n=1 Tax=Candidatus Poriferisocius sp. TaxID=3101276 RepID=UPI003B02E8FA
MLVVVFALVASACGGGNGDGEAPAVPEVSGVDGQDELEAEYFERLAEAVETLDPDAVCPDVVLPESFDGVAEVGRIEGGCALIEYVELGGRSLSDLRVDLAGDASVFAVGVPSVDIEPATAHVPQPPFDQDGYGANDWWHWEAMGAEKLWDPDGWVYDNSRRRVQGWPAGKQIVVAVIDDGVDGSHRDLDDNVLIGGDSCHRNPNGSHGTHVAGLVAAEQNNGVDVAGLAPLAKILPIKVHFTADVDANGNPLDQACKNIVPTLTQAIDLARKSGANVINMSLQWGTPRHDPETDEDFIEEQVREDYEDVGDFVRVVLVTAKVTTHVILGTDTVKWALDVARLQGIVAVASAGNCGDDRIMENADTDGDGLFDTDSKGNLMWYLRADQNDRSGNLRYFWDVVSGCDFHNQQQHPADYPGVIAVAATDYNMTPALFSTANGDVDVAAPGDGNRPYSGIISTVPGGTDYVPGTSMATPIVAAAVAHIKARFPQLSPDEIADALKTTASTHPRRTNSLGYGIIDPVAAIEQLDRAHTDDVEEPQLPPIIPEVGGPTPQPTIQPANRGTPRVSEGPWAAISTSSNHACGLRNDGTAFCWGYVPHNCRSLAIDPSYPLDCKYHDYSVRQPEGSYSDIAAGDTFTCGLGASGAIDCWYSSAGADDGWNPWEVQPPASDEEFTEITAGSIFLCAIKIDNTITCWGWNGVGQTDAPAGQYSAVSAGWDHSCAIKIDNTIVCWGENSSGQATPPAGQYSAVSAGWDHSCAIKIDNTIVCWGENSSGQATPPAGQYSAVSAGRGHSCAIKIDNTIVCWGENSSGQATPPAGQYSAVSAGARNSCAISLGGAIQCWGLHYTSIETWNPTHTGWFETPDGRFTTISAGGRHLCGIRVDQAIECVGDSPDYVLDAPEGQFTSVSAGSSHSCALATDRTITCWGYHEHALADVPDGEFSAVSAGSTYSCGLEIDGTIVCWGQHFSPTSPGNSPEGTYTAVTASVAGFACGLATDGAPICWGRNLGTSGIIENRQMNRLADEHPGQFAAIAAGGWDLCGIRLDQTVACSGDGYYLQALAAPEGRYATLAHSWGHACGIKVDRSIECWGDNGWGRLAAPAGEFTSISAGSRHTCAIRVDRSIECWGDNGRGQSTAPAGEFTSISGYADHSCATRADGSIACWGNIRTNPPEGEFTSAATSGFVCGLRADGTVECSSTPALDRVYGPVETPDGQFTAIVPGDKFMCGLRTSGEINCWGHVGAEVPEGRFTAISAGLSADPCGITISGSVDCWGAGILDSWDRIDIPDGTFTALSVDDTRHTCGLRTEGSVECWGRYYSAEAPRGQFTGISTSDTHACGLKADGTVDCWGAGSDIVRDAPEGQYTSITTSNGNSGGFSCGLRIDGTVACWGLLASEFGDVNPYTYASEPAG